MSLFGHIGLAPDSGPVVMRVLRAISEAARDRRLPLALCNEQWCNSAANDFSSGLQQLSPETSNCARIGANQERLFAVQMVIEDPVIFAIALDARDAQFRQALDDFDQPLFDARD